MATKDFINDPFRDRERIEIENLAFHEVSMELYTMRMSGNSTGWTFPAHSKTRTLTVEEILAQINYGNVAFVGTDGRGSHAVFRFCDLEAYKQLMNIPDAKDLPLQLTEENVINLLKINKKEKFAEELSKLVVTENEKLNFAYMTANIADISGGAVDSDNFESWKIKAIERHTGRKLYIE